jgi:hypothetical protein
MCKCCLETINRFMPMRGQTEYITTPWIPVVPSISQLVMVVIERRWQLHMLMKLATARNHLQHQMNLWVGSVLSISHQAQQLVNSVGTGSQTIVLIEKVASAMGF